jgi:hypothetical protein
MSHARRVGPAEGRRPRVARRVLRIRVLRIVVLVAVLVVGAVVVVQLNGGTASSGTGGFNNLNNGLAPIVTAPATPPEASATAPSSGEKVGPSVPAATGRLPEAPLSEAGPGDVADLQPALRHAILAAIYAARQDGVHLDVNSGYRTPAHQEELYEEGIAKYGSAQAAHAWVLPPDQSDHVKGDAVDVEAAAGIAWLEKNGVRFGLCRKYANEDWHFELLAPAAGSSCPPMLPHA